VAFQTYQLSSSSICTQQSDTVVKIQSRCNIYTVQPLWARKFILKKQ